jgi:hypothetical protein
MTTTLTRAVWEERCDRVYLCRVERGDTAEGFLTVSYIGNGTGRPLIVHRQNVPLEYGAHFGAENIAEWQGLCADVIRFPELRNPTQ